MNIIYLIDFNCPYSYIGLERPKDTVKNIKCHWMMLQLKSEK